MDDSEPLETDPTGRYTRTNKLLGKGAYKLVYKGFDNSEAIEVAWNKLQTERLSEADISKVSREVDFLKMVQHKNIINFFSCWESTTSSGKMQIDFITELMTSGTLKEFIRRARHIRLKVIRRWSLNILEGIAYLHSFNPPIMHRDLKCDNVFINGNVGEVKIGDLGLSCVKKREKAYTVIGTPEFMAPELYEEEYTEKVDVYAFGMCMLEMLTMEYPYGECENAAQIFRKVLHGEKPAQLLKLVDSVFKDVIIRCLEREERRPTALELLQHPLFKDWREDDGRLSNVDLVRAETSDGGVNIVPPPHPPLPDVETSDMLVHHSPNLGRDVVVAGSDKMAGEPMPTDGGSIKVELKVPVHGTLKSVAFMFDPKDDSAEEIANEMLVEFGLNKDQVKEIQRDIEAQVKAVVASTQHVVSAPSSSMHHDMEISLIGRNAQARDENGTTPSSQRLDEATAHGSSQSMSTSYSASSKGKSGSRLQSAHGDSLLVHDSKIFMSCMELMDHCASGRYEPAKSKIGQGAAVTYSDYDQRTPLHLAASEGHLQIVELLLQHGADGTAKDRWGSTPLNDAVKGNHQGTMDIFARYGYTTDDADGLPSKEFASMELLEFSARGLHDLVRERLVSGVSAQFADYDKRTPLHLAASEGHADVAELLLVNGASMTAKDRFGRTPIDDAVKNGNKVVLRVMKQYGGDVPSKLVESSKLVGSSQGMDLIDHASRGRWQQVKECLDRGVDVNFQDYDGRTALHLAAAEGHVRVAQLLLDSKASQEIKDRWNSSPLDEAEKRNRTEVVELLEAYGAGQGTQEAIPGSATLYSWGGSADSAHQPKATARSVKNIDSLQDISLASTKWTGLTGVDKFV